MYWCLVFEVKDWQLFSSIRVLRCNGTRRKGEIYISFTRYPHDLRIEHESRTYTRDQMENSDSSYRDTRRDLKNVIVIAVTPGIDVTWSIPIITTTLSFQEMTLRLDARHRATNTFSITIVNFDTGKDTLETDVLMEDAELFVAISTLDEFNERSI